jgi:phosphoserine phosphatase RsbU/P
MTTSNSQELELLHQEIIALRNEKSSFETQRYLLEKLVAMARTPEKEELLEETLQEALDICTKISGAEKGSLFLLDNNGKVTDSILTQREAAADIRARLIGNVLDKGLAGWVYNHHKVGLIRDTEIDDRWLQLPQQPYIVRSALAVPILWGDQLLGILTLLHSQPQKFTCEIADLLEVTCNQIALVVENARLFGELEKSYSCLELAKQEIEIYSKALDEEMQKGIQIQKDFLPSEIPQLPNWEITACFYPARQVAGDFYDVFMLPGNHVGLVIADVCDKGVGAALFMALFRSLIRVFSGQHQLNKLSLLKQVGEKELVNLTATATQIESDSIRALEAVTLTNDYVAQEHSNMNMFATLFFGVLNPNTGSLFYINGGHEPLYIIDSTGIRETLKHTGPAVGMMPNMKFKVQQTNLKPGDILIGYTDGVPEAHSMDGKLFGNKQLLSLLEKSAPSATALIERLKADLFTHINTAPQFDDITMLALQRLG